jgi:hypothetical protein
MDSDFPPRLTSLGMKSVVTLQVPSSVLSSHIGRERLT